MDNAELLMLLSGAVLVMVEVARSVPAWLRVKKTGSGDGISPVSVGVLAGSGPGWVAVASMAESVAAVIAGSTWLVFHVLLWREVIKAEPLMKRTIAVTALLSFVATGLVAVAGQAVGHMESALGFAIIAASAFYSLPALYRGMKSPTTTGLSLMSLAVNSVEGAIYFVAGVGLGGITRYGDSVPAYAAFGGLALMSNLPRLVRVGVRRVTDRDGSTSDCAGSAAKPRSPAASALVPVHTRALPSDRKRQGSHDRTSVRRAAPTRPARRTPPTPHARP